ncbi:uncharacterized protein LOC135116042 [Scylla paramamosain]|uniref:uncharacterized protein LOC135116042 n=1 Tax=Scylla paramamosain TaxID=85552 RepID=UPI003083215C
MGAGQHSQLRRVREPRHHFRQALAARRIMRLIQILSKALEMSRRTKQHCFFSAAAFKIPSVIVAGAVSVERCWPSRVAPVVLCYLFLGWCAFKSPIMYAGVACEAIERKSANGKYDLRGGRFLADLSWISSLELIRQIGVCFPTLLTS